MSPQTNRNILLGMLGSVILGAAAGFVIPDVMLMLGIIGRLFVNALQILLLPLIPALIIVGVGALGHTSKITRAAASTVIYFVGTTLAAVVIGIILAFAFQPGGAADATGAFIPDMVNRARAGSFTDVFSAYIPDNLFAAITSGQYLGLIILSLVFAGVLAAMGNRGRVVTDFFKALAEISLRIVNLLLYAAPVGLFALVGSTIARNPAAIQDAGGNLVWLTVTFLLALILHGLVVLPLLLHFVAKRNPIEYLFKTAPALTTALGTASSAATLPFTYRNVVEDSGVDSRAGSLVLPLGASINANGTGLYLAVATIFTAQLFGIPLDILQIIAIALLAVILSLGTTGIPGGALFTLGILFTTLDFPFQAYGVIGLLVVVDWLFDRGRTLLNVWGDIVGAAIIGESFEFKTARATRGVTTPERAPARRERTPSRRERPTRERQPRERKPRERQTRERQPRERQTENGRGGRRSAAETRENDRQKRERKPERPPRPERAPKKEAEPKRPTPAKQETRPPIPPPPQPPRPPQPKPERQEPARPSRREPERPAPTEKQSPRPPAIPAPGDSVTEERGRLAASLAAQMRDIEPQRTPPPEKPTERQETPEKPEEPEIRRRPLRAEVRPEPRPEEPPEGAPPPPVDATEPEPAKRLETAEPPKREVDEEKPEKPRPEPPPTPEPKEEPETKEEPAKEEKTEPEPRHEEEPRLRDLLSNLAASREQQEVEPEQPGEESKPEEEKQEPEGEKPISFGRSRTRRGIRPGEQPAPSESERPTDKERKDGFDVDSVPSFGRGRRKRSR